MPCSKRGTSTRAGDSRTHARRVQRRKLGHPLVSHRPLRGGPAAPAPHEDQKYRRTLPEGHELIALSHTHADDLAGTHSTTRDRVHVIPNCHDPRHIWKMHPAAEAMLAGGSLNRDIVQVYPFCDSGWLQGIPQLLRIFEAMQRHADAALVLCDANAQTDGAKLAWSLAAELAPNVEVFRMSSIEGCTKGTLIGRSWT